jgi:hypothetical protein
MEPDPVLASNTREWLLRAKEDLDNATRIDGTLAPAVEDVTPLTEYAARFRYPGAPWEPTLQEAQESIDLARTFVHTLLTRLPPCITSFDDSSKDLWTNLRPGGSQ